MENSEDHEQLRVGGHCSMNTHSGRPSITRVRYHRSAARRVEFTLPAATSQIMADSTKLSLTARDPEGSRTARRLRRSGEVPGVIYGGDGEPSHFSVDARILRNTLAHSGAILDISIDGGKAAPVLVKDLQRHPVRGDIMHVDFLRVNMNETIHTTVVLELLGADDAPGVVEGGVLSQETRELNIEALPGDIPDSITHDVSGMQMNDTLHAVRGHRAGGHHAPRRPRGDRHRHDHPADASSRSTTEIETETALVGEDGEAAEGEEPPSEAARVGRRVLATSPEGLRLHTGRLADRRARQPRARLRRDAAQRRLQGRRRAGPALGSAQAEEEVRGRAGRGPHRVPAGPRVALLKPQTYMNEAGRSAGPARGSFKLDLDRVLVLHDEIDLPFGEIRVAAGRRAGRPQRPEVAQARARLAGLPPRADRRRAAGLDRPGDRRRLRARAAGARPPPRSPT